MGLFDTLEQVAGIGGGQGSTQANPEAAMATSAVTAVIQMVQSQPGGIAGVVQKFEAAGLGGVAQSWVSNGQNQSVSGEQVQGALGTGAIGQVAQKLGVSPNEAAGHIAQYLPQILSHLTPAGQTPAAGGIGEIEGLLSRFSGQQSGT